MIKESKKDIENTDEQSIDNHNFTKRDIPDQQDREELAYRLCYDHIVQDVFNGKPGRGGITAFEHLHKDHLAIELEALSAIQSYKFYSSHDYVSCKVVTPVKQGLFISNLICVRRR
jgi:hypothetical protein